VKQTRPPRLFQDLSPPERVFALLVTGAIGLIALGGITLSILLRLGG
jgi:hypothetical protein